MGDTQITLYALSTCVHCRSCKDLLNQSGLAYDCIDVDKLDPMQRKQILEEVKQLNPKISFPTLVVGNRVIVGFKKEEIQEVLESK